jgi:hypothetical protein
MNARIPAGLAGTRRNALTYTIWFFTVFEKERLA